MKYEQVKMEELERKTVRERGRQTDKHTNSEGNLRDIRVNFEETDSRKSSL